MNVGVSTSGRSHWVLIPAFVGSNPTTPAICCPRIGVNSKRSTPVRFELMILIGSSSWPRTPAFHAENTGSNPVPIAKYAVFV